MQQFINLTDSEKNELFIRTASATRISPILLEKDFWVSWLLNLIFQMSISKDLVFKGGTSLSKCYGLIKRFSEDIDITIDKTIFTEGIKSNELSGKQFQKLLESNDQKAVDFVQNQFRPALEALIEVAIPQKNQWSVVSDQAEPKNLRFYYPTAVKVDDNAYVKQSVLIEIGVRGDVYPCEPMTVLSYVEAQFQNILNSDQVKIKTLKPVRTFWEKITLLHAENHRPEGKEHGERLSRHYYDVYQMIREDIATDALKNLNILHDVIENKTRFFKASWARYDEAVPAKLTIFPNQRLLPHLEQDYKNMNAMIFGNVPSFADILHEIKGFEGEFNRLS